MAKTKSSRHLPLSFILFVVIFLIAGVFFVNFFVFSTHTQGSKAAEHKPLPFVTQGPCTVSGRVMNVGSNPTLCPRPENEGGYQGINQLTVHLVGPGVNRSAPTQTGGSGQTGAFYFENVQPGIYNVCTDVPQGMYHYCNYPRVDGYSLYGTQCAKIDTRISCSGVRLSLSTRFIPTNTPVPPQPSNPPLFTNTPVPLPTVPVNN
jgi:hypothetical protein